MTNGQFRGLPMLSPSLPMTWHLSPIQGGTGEIVNRSTTYTLTQAGGEKTLPFQGIVLMLEDRYPPFFSKGEKRKSVHMTTVLLSVFLLFNLPPLCSHRPY
jgi:hypothetical protein